MKKLLFLLITFAVCSLKSQSTFTITVQTTPSSCIKGSANITVSGGVGNDSIVWSDGFLGSYHAGLDSGTYSITIYDSALNDTTISVYIEPKVCGLSAPGNFTPNGDGINDTWSVSNTSYYEEYHIEVFSRWGQKVFDAKNPFEKWDGKSFGSPVPDGTYYYVMEFTDKYFGKQIKNGSVLIIR